MGCYLCGRNSARVRVESRYDGTFIVCGVCDERGTFCWRCDKPIKHGEKKYEDNRDMFRCHECVIHAGEMYMESMVS